MAAAPNMQAAAFTARAGAALRMLLVFALAFACSFGTQRLALGDSAAKPVEGTLVGVGVYAANGTSTGYGRLVRSVDGEHGLQEQERVPVVDAPGGQLRLAAVGRLVDEQDPEKAVERDLAGHVRWTSADAGLVDVDAETGVVTAKANENGTAVITCALSEELAEQVDPALAKAAKQGAAAGTGADGEGAAAEDGASADGPASTSPDAGTAPGAATGADAAAGAGADAAAAPQQGTAGSAETSAAIPAADPTSPLLLAFTVRVVKHTEPYITSIEILDGEGNQISNAQRRLQLETAQTENYPLSARVTVHDPAEDRNETFTSTPQQGISELTGGAFGDLAWSIETDGDAAVDLATGMLSMNTATQARVTCSAASAEDDGEEPRSDTVTVQVGATELAPDDGQDEQDGQEEQGDASEGEGAAGEAPAQDPVNDGILHVVVSYNPKPRGEVAHLSSSIYGVGHTVYITTWEMSEDGGATWEGVPDVLGDDLRIPTEEPYLGRTYRSFVTLPEDELGRFGYSEPVTIEEYDGMTVDLYYDMVHQGQDALFSTDVKGAGAGAGTLEYLWEESADGGQNWEELDRGYLPTYSIYTELDRMGHQFRVTVTGADGSSAVSNTKMLAAYSDESSEPDDSGSPDAQDDPSESAEPGELPPDATLSDIVDKRGETSVNFPDGKVRTMKPAGNVLMERDSDSGADDEKAAEDEPAGESAEPADIYINPDANEKVAQEKAAEQQRINETVPGARWNPVYKLNDLTTQTDLEGNALAPLVSSLALAALAAGAVEKLLAYRRQKRPSAL